MATNGNKRKPRGKPFPKGNKVGNRYKPGESGNPDGRPKCTKSPSEVLQEIEKLGFSNMQDYMRLSEGGAAYIDFSALTREQAAAIQEITVDEYVDGKGEDQREVRKTKFKLADKRGALELLARHHKLLTDKLEVGADDDLLQVLAEGRQRAAAHAE